MTRVMLAGLAARVLWGTSHPLGLPDAQEATKEVVILTSFPKELFEAYKARAPGRDVEAVAAALAEARRLANAVPLDGKRASDRDVNDAFKGKAEVKSRLETEWDTAAKANYAKARELAESAAGRIK